MATDFERLGVVGAKLLQDMLQKGSYSPCRSVAVVSLYVNGTIHDTHEQICFHSLRRQTNGNLDDLDCIVSNIQTGVWERDKDVARDYLDYLANRSIVCDAFGVKDAEWMIQYNSVVADPNCASNIMLSGLIASRAISSQWYNVKLWHDLVRGGVSEDMAFFLCNLVMYTESNCMYYIPENIVATNAFMIPYAFTFQCLKEFLQHKCKQKLPFKVDDNYYGLYITWASYIKKISDLDSYDPSYHILCENLKKIPDKMVVGKESYKFLKQHTSGDTLKSLNPFIKCTQPATLQNQISLSPIKAVVALTALANHLAQELSKI